MSPSRPSPVYAQPNDSSSFYSEEEEDSDETMLDQKPMKDISENEQEEEEDDEEDETDDDNEGEETIPQPPVESKYESEGTESEDFDVHSPSTPNFTIKPCKPVDNPTTKSKKTLGKAVPPPAAVATSSTQARSSSKRPLESKVNGNKRSEEKSGSTRLWSENDQIAILKGMIDYQSNSGADPLADAAAFHDVMKKSLHVDVSKGQMIDKIRRMKKKYQTNVVKGENGQDPVFAKPHDSQLFELSKRIWRVNGETTTASNNNKVSNSTTRRRVKKKVKVENPQASSQENGTTDVLIMMKEEEEEKETKEDFWKKYPLLEKSLSEIPVLGKEFAKEAMWAVGNSSANELEEKWRKLKMEEIDLYKKKIELIIQETEMIQQTFKSS